MKIKQILAFLIASMLLVQPAAAAAAGSGTEEPAAGEQAETEPAEGQAEPAEGRAGQEAEETEGTETAEIETEAAEEIETRTEETEAEKAETEGTETAGTETSETATAAEDVAAKAGQEESRIVLELPVLEGSGASPFDFIMDPQGLITETKAARYGGAGFEEGATLYFKNTDGDHAYSHISDWLSIKSRSSVPVRVTVELAVEDAYDISFAQSASFSGGERSMYLALLDSGGNETAVGADGKAVLQMTLPACADEGGTAVCSFALTGCCSPDGDWRGMAGCPRITVNWTAEPLIPGEGAAYGL